MPSLQEAVLGYFDRNNCNARIMAERCGMSYPTALAVVNQGKLPRKAEHRDELRRFLELDESTWADIMLQASGIEDNAADSPSGALQLMVAHAMFSSGMTIQTLAQAAGIPYPTMLNLIRKGTIPRDEALTAIAGVLDLDIQELRAAAEAGRRNRKRQDPRNLDDENDEDDAGLAQLVARRIAQEQESIAGFAKRAGIGYLVLSRFLADGSPPEGGEVLGRLRRALELGGEDFDRALAASRQSPEPASVSIRIDGVPADAHPLQAALIRYVRDRKLTIKAVAKETNLSQITISRIIRHGAMPKRERTHRALRKLLDLSAADYADLISRDYVSTTTRKRREAERAEERGSSQSYHPADTDRQSAYEPDAALTAKNVPQVDAELLRLIADLDDDQQDQLRGIVEGMLEE